MKFSQRVKISNMYREWLKEESKKHTFELVDNPETFLAYLTKRGLLKEISPKCELMNATGCCDEYKRENNYTCDGSDLCASCIHRIKQEAQNG